MALDSSGNWYPVLPDQPPASPCVFSEVSACTGVPDAADGVDGDVRIDLATGDVYTKSNGVWELVGGSGGSANLSGADSPEGVVTPTAIYQIYRATNTDAYYWAAGLTNADWHQFV